MLRAVGVVVSIATIVVVATHSTGQVWVAAVFYATIITLVLGCVLALMRRGRS